MTTSTNPIDPSIGPYAEILLTLQTPPTLENVGRRCFECKTNTTSHWRKNPLDKSQDQCQKCSNAARSTLAMSQNSGKTCFECKATTSSMWIKNPLDVTQDQCKKCYQKINNAKAKALAQSGNSEKTCFKCNTTTTIQWYKNTLNKSQDQCKKCYNKAKKDLIQPSISTDVGTTSGKRKPEENPIPPNKTLRIDILSPSQKADS